MEKTFFNKNGDAVAYLSDDYDRTIYLWGGRQVAYLYNDRLVFGINGKHLGWFVDGVIFNHAGKRIGFTSGACPVAPSKEPIKAKKGIKDKIQDRWKESPFPKLQFLLAEEDLSDFLKEGQAYNPRRVTTNKK